jgi:hypothetical protein
MVVKPVVVPVPQQTWLLGQSALDAQRNVVPPHPLPFWQVALEPNAELMMQHVCVLSHVFDCVAVLHAMPVAPEDESKPDVASSPPSSPDDAPPSSPLLPPLLLPPNPLLDVTPLPLPPFDDAPFEFPPPLPDEYPELDPPPDGRTAPGKSSGVAPLQAPTKATASPKAQGSASRCMRAPR